MKPTFNQLNNNSLFMKRIILLFILSLFWLPTLRAQGKALNFDGSNDYVNVNNTIGNFGTANFTVETWVRTTATSAIIIAKRNAISYGNFFQVGVTSGKLFLEVNASSIADYTAITSDKTINDGLWHHVAAMRSSGQLLLYIDGQLATTAGVAINGNPNISNSVNTTIGAWVGISQFNGSLDEMRIWNTARTSSQIQSNMLGTVSTSSTGLLAYYNFDGASNTALIDRTSNSNNGTLTNFALSGTSSNWVESYAMVVPTASAATGIGSAAFTANWAAPTVGTLTNYLLDVSTSNTFASVITGSPFTVASGTTSKAITGLSSSTTYYYRVRADKTSVTGQGGYSTITTANTTMAPPGNALNFSSTSSISFTNPFSTATDNFTLETWVNWNGQTTTQNSGYCIVLINGNAISPYNGYGFQLNTNNGKIGYFMSGIDGRECSTITPGIWYHLALVRNNGVATLFVNGVPDPNTTSTTPNIPAASAKIGLYGFAGKIDEVRMWNVAKTQAQIQAAMYSPLQGNEANLRSYYNFDDGIAGGTNTGITNLADRTSNGNSGTLTNFALSGTTSNWVESYAMVVPTAGEATAATSSSFTVNWTAPTVGTVTNYLIHVSTSSNFTSFVPGTPFSAAAGTTSKVITGFLTSGTTYYYRVLAEKTSVTQQGGYSATKTVCTTSTATNGFPIITVCVGSSLLASTHTTTGATGIGSASGLPAGVTASWANDIITIQGSLTVSGTFNYSIPLIVTCGSAVNATGTIIVNPKVTPIFTQVNPICYGSAPSFLPETSNNGITGYWLPVWNSLATTTYDFTQDGGQCATSTSMTITVNPKVTPTFTQVNAICSGATLSALPTTSNNAITGTWSPALNNTATTTYTFTPTAGLCANTTAMTITVNPRVTPSFTAVAPICSGATLSALPTTSTNAITGTWSPALNNTATTTYAFTPTSALCATAATLTIDINATTPPTAIATQVYAGSGTIANLTATGSTIQWYSAATAGTVLPTTTSLVDSTIYYASQTVSGCESPTRVAVTAKKISEGAQTLCATETVANLVGTPSAGATANWFTAPSGGAALASSTSLSTATYYVEQTNPLTVATLGSGFSGPWAVAVQADGKILVADMNNNAIKRMNADGTDIVTLGSGFNQPGGVAVQADGKILVSEISNSGIKRMNADGTGIVTLGSGLNFPFGVAVQADGKILVADYGNFAIKRMNADGTNIVTLGSGFNEPYCVAVQADGKILVADAGNNAIKRMNADGTGIVTLGSGFVRPYSIAVQADGKILVADTNNSAIKRMNADGTGIVTLGSGFDFLTFVTLQADGKMVLADRGISTITRITEPAVSNRVAVNVTVNPKTTPSFTQVSAICSGASLSALPTTSTNAITGTWSPALNNTATTTYTFTPTAGLCANTTTMTITVNPIVTPTFTAVAPICSGATLSALPTTSNNGITGTWSPAVNNTATTLYTFTPTAGLCANTTAMTITVNPKTAPTFTQVSAICSGATLSALPTTSTNAITGTWSPALNNTATTLYTFTPTAGLCANTTAMTVTVNPKTTPSFTQVAAVCVGATISALPTTSTDGITGTWSPALNITATTLYTFAPTAGLCANTTTMTITVNPKTTPTFTQVNAIAPNSSLAALPTTSNNSITGTWLPALNNTVTTTYTFTPTAGQCANATAMTITVLQPASSLHFSAGANTVNLGPTLGNFGTGDFAIEMKVKSSPATDRMYLLSKRSFCGYDNMLSIFIQSNGKIYVEAFNNQFNGYDFISNAIVADNTWHHIALTRTNGYVKLYVDGVLDYTTSSNVPVNLNNNYNLVLGGNTPCTTEHNFPYFTGNMDEVRFWSRSLCQTEIQNNMNCEVLSTGNGLLANYHFNQGNVNTNNASVATLTDSSGNNNTGTLVNFGLSGTTSNWSSDAAVPSGVACSSVANVATITPTFTQVSAICTGATSSGLPTNSNNNIVGTWSPAFNNLTTTTYTFTPNAGQCADTATMTVTVNPATVTPTFTQVSAICPGTSSDPLPTTSNEGIVGTWSPALNNLATTTYSFTPAEGQCSLTATMTITVNPSVIPTFTQVAPICYGSDLAELPTTSLDGISGTWYPPIINWETTTYTFTRADGLCGTATMTVVVNSPTTPYFNQVEAVCVSNYNEVLNQLPSTSLNGIVGVWDRWYDNQYVFTPNPGQCATQGEMTINVQLKRYPYIETPADVCQFSNFTLPTSTADGIMGTWSPAFDSNDVGTRNYTFTPNSNYCATVWNTNITVNPLLSVSPWWNIRAFCPNDSVYLPTTSPEGITGTWSPDHTNAYPSTYTFTPNAGQTCVDMTPTYFYLSPISDPYLYFDQIAPICEGGTFTLPNTSANGWYVGSWSPAVNNTATTTYTFTANYGPSCQSNTFQMTVEVYPASVPTFNEIAPICAGATLSALPTTSNEGITGSWSPALNNTATTIYTFTPAAGQCATTATMTITVNPNVTPTFTQVNTVCAGASLDPLPTSSLEGITGTWSPDLDSSIVGTRSYFFTPSENQCAQETDMIITVMPLMTPDFGNYIPQSKCPQQELHLPLTSMNGISGTWSNTSINNGMFDLYTFTPNPGQCGAVRTYEVINLIYYTPTFAEMAPICAGSTLVLPTQSREGYQGYWSPSANNQSSTLYTFYPNEGCGRVGYLYVEVTPTVTPLFNELAPICAGVSIAPLPTISTNAITGTWSPALNNLANTTYTFTPAAGQCATTTTMTITVHPNVAPTFTAVAPICSEATLSALPTTSTNAITGTWLPALNNLATTTYTFTPTAGQCANSADMSIVVLTKTMYYRDVDNDGFGNGTQTQMSCTGVPVGYVINATDCNDNNNTVYPGATEICGDGLDNNCNGQVDEGCIIATPTAAAQTFCAGATVANLVATGTALKWYTSATGGTALANTSVLTTATYYVSQTLTGIESARTSVAVTINTTPALASQSYFVSGGIPLSSISGYGSSYKIYASVNAVSILPSSTVLTSGTYYATQTQNGCESTRSMVNVVVYALTSVSSPACGSTLTAISAPITATAVANATNYLFEVTGNGSTRTYYSATNSFNLTQLQGSTAYNTVYSIRVAAGFSGQYGDFGTVCSLTTPALANTTQVISTMCGTILASLTTPIYCGQIVNAQAYRFEFTTGGVSKTIDSATNSVQISNLTGGPAYGTAYSVRVAAQVAGTWQAYGATCTVTTPAASTQIRTNQCNTTLANKWAILYCSAVTGATGYRFEWSNGGTVLTYSSTTSNMQLGNYTGWAINTTYSVRVAVQFGGTWQAYGSACNVKSPATFARQNAEETVSLTVKAVPNPFETEYVLMAQGGNQTPIQVAVYDMLGKQVEQFSVEASELENRSLGTNYSSGIYNVMISQGDDQQVVRIIKK
ncbi:MAG: hypothetical protein CFE24_13140 [Flavobacterium sp. BFFFF2]|nr:MAG: hypothetical protein CFE24_13140 [Flavobacterium sp. BFFFF2]